MKISTNKGMYIEQMINNTIKYYDAHKIAVLRKQWVPVKIHYNENRELKGSLSHKCDVDYYGFLKPNFFVLEAKQSSKKFFDQTRIKDHQRNFLNLVEELGGMAFLIIYFQQNQQIYIVPYWKLKLTKWTSNNIYIQWFEENAKKVEVKYPGWLDIATPIKKWSQERPH